MRIHTHTHQKPRPILTVMDTIARAVTCPNYQWFVRTTFSGESLLYPDTQLTKGCTKYAMDYSQMDSFRCEQNDGTPQRALRSAPNQNSAQSVRLDVLECLVWTFGKETAPPRRWRRQWEVRDAVCTRWFPFLLFLFFPGRHRVVAQHSFENVFWKIIYVLSSRLYSKIGLKLVWMLTQKKKKKKEKRTLVFCENMLKRLCKLSKVCEETVLVKHIAQSRHRHS